MDWNWATRIYIYLHTILIMFYHFLGNRWATLFVLPTDYQLINCNIGISDTTIG